MEQRFHKLYKCLRILAAVIWVGIILFAVLHRQDFTLERILEFTPRSPLLAFGVLMALFTLKSLTVVFYSGFLYAASGVLFPLPWAILVSVCGTLLMALVPYTFARRIGAQQADLLRQRHPKLGELERIRRQAPLAFVVVLRCVNVINFDIGSMYCGAVRLDCRAFLLGSLLGKLADLILWSTAGASLDRRDPVLFFVMLAVDLSIALAVTLWSKKRMAQED